jgi:hydroxyethylthiazole kinase-like uncharacterized protein yjeF
MAASNQILTVAQMVAAEQALVDGGQTISGLMDIAGCGAADLIWRVAAHRPVTVLCGPGNNGGDGYVIARELQQRGGTVRVVAPLPPGTDAAKAARDRCDAPMVADARGGVLVDCLFGSGLARPLDPDHLALLQRMAGQHALRIAIDLPSGIASDSGAVLNKGLPTWHLTIALGAWKFAHALMPALPLLGERRLVPIGVQPVAGAAQMLVRPRLTAPPRDAHKYTRGLVLVIGGAMTGAATLACEAALRGGAGAVRLAAAEAYPALPADVVLKTGPLADLLADPRNGSVLAGPGLGRDHSAATLLAHVLAADSAAVIDADGLMLLEPAALAGRTAPLILTPHGGEMAKLLDAFGITNERKVAQARDLAAASGAVVVFKGPDTVLAAPDGRLVLAPSADGWLSVAGSGDVLAGLAASRLAVTGDPFIAACEALWLHGEAARLSPKPFTAGALAQAIPLAYAACL